MPAKIEINVPAKKKRPTEDAANKVLDKLMLTATPARDAANQAVKKAVEEGKITIHRPSSTLVESLTQKFSVDVKANRINRFDQQWYQVNTEIGTADLKSVTTVLQKVHPMDAGLIEWFKKAGRDANLIRDEAGQMGSHIHKLIEMTLRGDPVTFQNEDGTRNCTIEEFEKYALWCRWYREASKGKEQMRVLFVEQIVYNLEEEIAGTIDLICDTNKGRRIKDWKTGSIGHGEIQISKYVDMANKMGLFGEITGADIVQIDQSLNKKGYRITEVEEIEHNIETFNLDLQLFARVYPNFRPKYKTYPNTITLEMLDSDELLFGETE